jgi:hypothetical protein
MRSAETAPSEKPAALRKASTRVTVALVGEYLASH